MIGREIGRAALTGMAVQDAGDPSEKRHSLSGVSNDSTPMTHELATKKQNRSFSTTSSMCLAIPGY